MIMWSVYMLWRNQQDRGMAIAYPCSVSLLMIIELEWFGMMICKCITNILQEFLKFTGQCVFFTIKSGSHDKTKQKMLKVTTVFEIRLKFTGQKTSKLEYLYRFYWKNLAKVAGPNQFSLAVGHRTTAKVDDCDNINNNYPQPAVMIIMIHENIYLLLTWLGIAIF